MAGAIAWMTAIDAALPTGDGLACFNRMYLEVTQQVERRLAQGFFADPGFMSRLDVLFANRYFDAVRALAVGQRVPTAWAPLAERRLVPGIEPIQFALGGMDAHIVHDLPLAVVDACTALGTDPAAGSHHDDYQKIDGVLDAIEQSVRQSYESGVVLDADRHGQAVLDLLADFSIVECRNAAWASALVLWNARGRRLEYDLLCDGLVAAVDASARPLLEAV